MKNMLLVLLSTMLFHQTLLHANPSYHDKQDSLHLSIEEKNWLENNPMIKIATMNFWATDIQGNNRHTDLIKLLNKYGDLHIVPVKFDAWEDGLKEAISGEHIHGITNLSWSKEREKKILYTKAYNFIPNIMIVRNDNDEIKSLDDLRGKHVCLTNDSITNTVIKELSKNIKIITLRTNKEMYQKLSSSQACVAAFAYSIEKGNFAKYHLKIAKKIYGKYSEVSVGISKRYPLLQSIINKTYKHIPAEELTALQNRVYAKAKGKTIDLTKSEKEWLTQHPIITVGGGPDWAPFDFVNKKGVYDGIANDYLHLLSLKTGLQFDIKVDKWSNNLQKMQDKKIDLLHAIYYTDDRAKYMHYTKAYFEMLDYFFIRDDLNIKSIKDLNGKRVAIPKGYAHGEILKKEFPLIKTITVDTFNDAIDAVLENRADALFDTYASLSYAMKKNAISTIVPFQSYRGHASKKLYMATHKDNPILATILDKGFSLITQQEKETIYNKWISSDKKSLITLSEEEQEWLDDNPTVSFTGDPNWLPFEAFDKSGKYEGIVADYLHELEKSLPLKFQVKQTKTWLETLALAKKGEVDVISDTLDSEAMRKNYTPLSPYLDTPFVIVMRSSHDFVNDLNDISDKKIALVKEHGCNAKIKKKYPTQRFIYIENADSALEQLSMGKIDAAILSMPKAGYLIRSKGYSNLKIVGKTSLDIHLTLFVLNSKPTLYAILEKAMGSLSTSERSSIIKEWQNIEFAKKTDYTLLYQIAGLLGFFLLAALYWNRKLSKEVIKRKEVETQLQTLIDNIPLQILVTTYDGKFLMVNPQTLKDHGLTKEDMQKYNVSAFYADEKERDEVLKELQTKRSINQKIIQFKRLDGTIRSMMVSILPITYEKQDALLSIAVDLSERLELEKALSHAKEEAEEANLAKSEFLANMSHEIRTPMNAVMGFSELLAKQISDPIQKDYLDSIQRGGNTLLSIINDILDLSKIEAGKLEIVLESVDIKQLALEMESIFSVKLIQKNIHFELDIDPTLPKYLLLDNIRIRQILFNLIGNAIKFTPRGFVKLGLKKRFEDKEKSKIDLEIYVQDSGIGIPKKNIDHIFDAFEQPKEQNSQKYGGTGLGLAISKKLTIMMNGTISVKSEVGEGSTFTINLSDVPISSVEAISTQKRSSLETIAFKKATILIVDDIKDNRKLVASTLGEYHFDFLEADNGKEAITLLRNVKIDLIFMDIKMPVMDGYTATKIIKEDETLKEIPIIALTASVMGKDLEKIKEHHFDGYLRKPVSQEAILAQMEKFLAHDRLELPNAQEDKIDTHAYANLPQVIKALETEHSEIWNEIKDRGDFSLISDFSQSLANLGAQNGITILSQYAKVLQSNCDTFDIDKIDFMMNSYPALIEKLRELKNA